MQQSGSEHAMPLRQPKSRGLTTNADGLLTPGNIAAVDIDRVFSLGW
jgi:hypothetical protein